MKKAATRTAPGKTRRDAGRSRGEPVREAVLERALEEIAVHGLAGVNVDRVARAAEVNKTTIYRRWPTREALVIAALARVSDDVSAELVDTGSLRGDLALLVKTLAAFLTRPEGRALARSALGAPTGDEGAAFARRHLEDRVRGPIAALLARGSARGEWRPEVPPEVVFGALVGAMLHRAALEHAPLSRRWQDALLDLVVLGVAPRMR